MKRFFVLGGDRRQIYLCRLLKKHGFLFTRYCQPNDVFSSLKNMAAASDIIICPTPFTKNGTDLFSEHHLPNLEISALLQALKPEHTILGGNIPDFVKNFCTENGIAFYDFMKSETVALKNTVATAEGVIAEAITISSGNLHQSSCLVLGFGRCGMTLASKLKGLSAYVAVFDSNPDRLALAYSEGFSSISLEQMKKEISSFSYIFNTIPQKILPPEITKSLIPDTTVIDIASLPGGFDIDALRQEGISAKHCPGLPGRYSPEASGKILFDMIMELNIDF